MRDYNIAPYPDYHELKTWFDKNDKINKKYIPNS